ncbi:hypothetical protein AK830_g12056 [Neonectria ditissima]|uniref:SprT-like domain-containing protein n=1 Tax=Neonectria ditissima TaxID=78410 RepID=A0A0P7B6A8_9HYPO|nr:hypothetical protein AK830_g12056 [Neonectria ditissima]
MAFWVDDGGRSQGASATGRGPYIVGGKRRVSHSDSGDGGDGFDYKRTRFAAGELTVDSWGSTPSPAAYAYSNDNHHGSCQATGYASGHAVGPADGFDGFDGFNGFNSPIDDDYYHHDYDHDRTFNHNHNHDLETIPLPITPPASVAGNNHAFFVIRERSPTPEIPAICPLGPVVFGPNPGPAADMGPVLAPPGPGGPAPAACSMERTQSGLSISSDTSQHSLASLGPDDDESACFRSDLEAARLVRDHVAGLTRRRRPGSQHGRILKALINPKSGGGAPVWELDNQALRSIFSAANELFFANRLTGLVTWDWSHPASAQYQAHIVGTTALRRRREPEHERRQPEPECRRRRDPGHECRRPYETLIVLSSPILKDTKYNRRLLISTFLHEMIHSYLFVTCGLKAGRCGGHTEGFRQIAETIDAWVGRGYLRLGEMEADLEQFREHDERGYEDKRDNCAEEEWKKATRESSPWRRWDGRAERDRDDYDYYPTEPRPPQQPQPSLQYLQQPGHEDWQWHQREGFLARGARGVGSPYV